jgi:probable phosphoglycerate mutase
MLATRVYAALEMILASPCQTKIVVTHGFALTFVVAAWVKMAIEDIGYIHLPVSSGSITHLRENEFWKDRAVITLGDTSHLAGL